MAGDGALVGELSRLERRDERAGLARLDQLALLARDGEVVRELALVDELERDAAVPNFRLGQRELELLHRHGHGRGRRSGRPGRDRRSRDERRERNREREGDAIHQVRPLPGCESYPAIVAMASRNVSEGLTLAPARCYASGSNSSASSSS